MLSVTDSGRANGRAKNKRVAAGADQFSHCKRIGGRGRFKELNPDLMDPERRSATMFSPRFLSSAGFAD